MKNLSRFSIVLATLAVLIPAYAFAADPKGETPSQYSYGDQTFSANAGLFIPFFLLPTGTWLLAPSSPAGPPHLSVGPVLSISWAAYVAPSIRVGAEIGFDATFSPNVNALYMFPILAKASYVFTMYPFEIPVTLAAGLNIVKYIDQVTTDILIRPATSLYWIYNSSWSFGVNLNYWFDMQFAADPTKSRIGNLLDTSLSLLYHY